MVAQGAGIGETAEFGDFIDADAAMGQMLLRALQPLIQQPAGRGLTGRRLKTAQKRARTHPRLLRQRRHGMAGGKMLIQIIKHQPQALTFPRLGDGPDDLLRLRDAERQPVAWPRYWRLQSQNPHAQGAGTGRCRRRCPRRS